RRILVLAFVKVPADEPFRLAIAGVELAVRIPADPLAAGNPLGSRHKEEEQSVELIDVLADGDGNPAFTGNLEDNLLAGLALRDSLIEFARRFQLAYLIVFHQPFEDVASFDFPSGRGVLVHLADGELAVFFLDRQAGNEAALADMLGQAGQAPDTDGLIVGS